MAQFHTTLDLSFDVASCEVAYVRLALPFLMATMSVDMSASHRRYMAILFGYRTNSIDNNIDVDMDAGSGNKTNRLRLWG